MGFLLIGVLCFNLVSAGWFSNFFEKITGDVVSGGGNVSEPGLVGKDNSIKKYFFNGSNVISCYDGDVNADLEMHDVSTALGKIGNAYNFSGSTSSYVVVPGNILYQKSEFSFSAWVKTSDKNKAILSIAESNSRANGFLIFSSSSIYVKESRKAIKFNLNDDNWHNLVVTISSVSKQMKVYIDGRLVGTSAISSKAILSGGIVIGQDQDKILGGFQKSQSFKGLIDEVVFFDKVLTEKEVTENYNNGEGKEVCQVIVNPESERCEERYGERIAYNGGIYLKKFCADSSTLREMSCINGSIVTNDAECNCLTDQCVLESNECELLVSTLNLKHSCVTINSLGYRRIAKKYFKIDLPEKCKDNECSLRFDVYTKDGKELKKSYVSYYNFKQIGNMWESYYVENPKESYTGVNGDNRIVKIGTARRATSSGTLIYLYDDIQKQENSVNQIILSDSACGDYEAEIYVCDNVLNNNTPSVECVDSDGGLNPTVFGSTNVKMGSFELEHEDACALILSYDSDGTPGGWQSIENCSGEDCYVEEAFCRTDESGNFIDADADELISCPSGCLNGQCL